MFGAAELGVRFQKKMAEKAIRFMIVADSGQHSNAWTIWTQNNDCYMGSRGIAHEYKASFHESGQCHIGLSSDIRKTLIADPSWKGKSRLFDKWDVRIDLEHGEKEKLIELLFPFSHLGEFDVSVGGAEFKLSCGEGQIASVALFRANMGENSIVKSDDESVSEVGRLGLSNGQYIVVVHRMFAETDEYMRFFEQQANAFNLPSEQNGGSGRTYQKGEIDPTKPSVRAMLGYKNDDGRYWIEMSFTKLFATRT